MAASDGLTIADGVALYLDSTRNRTGTGSYPAYAESVLDGWRTWTSRERGVERLSELCVTDLRRYVQHLRRRVHDDDDRFSASSATTYYNVVRGCLEWLVEDARLDDNPAARTPVSTELPTVSNDRDGQQFWDSDRTRRLLRYVDRRARDAVDADGTDADGPVRDRAIVATLTFTGVRAAEVFSHPRDDRDGRNGLTWDHVSLGENRILVLGKSQEWEDAPLPEQALHALEQLRRLLDPPAEDWPVFPTTHGATLTRTIEAELAERGWSSEEVDALTESATRDEVLREYEITPPSITTEGARSVMKRLCDGADLEIEGEYLKPHGARRGLGHTLYGESPQLAQSTLRHQDIRITHSNYSDIAASDVAEDVSRTLGGTWGSDRESTEERDE